MKSLFPELENEILSDRLAEKREKQQRARNYLRGRDLSWLINYLLEHGPKAECQLLSAISEMDDEEHVEAVGNILGDLCALHLVKKLWRVSQGIHPGAGVTSYIYGIEGVHKRPKKVVQLSFP